MRPDARVAAAIDILDRILAGEPAEKALTTWARGNRFAGSGDRAAIRDHVFDALRCRRSFAALGGAETGRGLMIGAWRAAGRDPAEVFTGDRFAPAPLGAAEAAPPALREDWPEGVRLDCPDWLLPELHRSLGEEVEAVLDALRRRAPVFLRVNLARATVGDALQALAADGIAAERHPLSETALRVTEGGRRVAASRAYRDGLVELQDAASQAVVDALFPIPDAARVLDYCAGGGGKALAIAARTGGEVFAHDADPARMKDLPERARRAGARITPVATADLAELPPVDVVLVDAPCSGSGAWRRQPEAKWALTPDRLERLTALQAGILDAASARVAPGGRLAYATCSLLDVENDQSIRGFLARSRGWRLAARRRLTPLDGGDGFFIATLIRE